MDAIVNVNCVRAMLCIKDIFYALSLDISVKRVLVGICSLFGMADYMTKTNGIHFNKVVNKRRSNERIKDFIFCWREW
mgnify:CR=1 FL=1